MAALVIQATGLRKSYAGPGRGRFAAVDGLDLVVESGGVHGLLGPGGAGKTTTLRLLLGLARRDAGEVRLLGRPVPRELPQAMARIGAVVQGAGPTPAMGARRNLDLLARAAGVPRDRVGEVLERVGLDGRRRTRRLQSPGVRPRLALAAALLRRPDLLILDQPTDGLDAEGSRSVWQLVRDLTGEGVSVLVTSAVLEDVRAQCDRVTLLDRGRSLGSGAVDDLLGEGRTRTRVGTDDPERAASVLRRDGYDVVPDEADRADRADLLVAGPGHPGDISRVLADHRIFVRELTGVRPDLDDVLRRARADQEPDPASEAELQTELEGVR